jgi:hypothetical protein
LQSPPPAKLTEQRGLSGGRSVDFDAAPTDFLVAQLQPGDGNPIRWLAHRALPHNPSAAVQCGDERRSKPRRAYLVCRRCHIGGAGALAAISCARPADLTRPSLAELVGLPAG